MFDDLDGLAAQLLARTPTDDPAGRPEILPDLDHDRSLVDHLVTLERVKAAAEARSMLIMAAMHDWAHDWQQRHDPDHEHKADGAQLAAAEIAAALRLSPITATFRVRRATRVTTRLAGTHAAFARGDIDLGKVLAIDEATDGLDAALCAQVEQRVLPGAVNQTCGELRRAVRRAVIAADPGSAEARRKEAVRGRSVRRYPRPDGMSALEAVLSAIDTGEVYDLIDEVARRTKTTGDTRTMDARRADAIVLLLLGREPHLNPDDDPPLPTEPPPAADDTPPDPDDDDTRPDAWDEDAEPDAGSGEERQCNDEPTDASERDAIGSGERDRDERDSGDSGWPPDRSGSPGDSDDAHEPGDREDPGPVEPSDLDEWFAPIPDPISELAALALSAMTTRTPPALPWVTINHDRGPDGALVTVGELQGYGPITAEHAETLLAAGSARTPDLPSGRQPSRDQARAHDPPRWLDREVRARDGTCRFPGCCQPTHRIDVDHTIAHPLGLTVAGNLGGLCRLHHRIKQSGWWTLRQHNHARFEWTSIITARTYTTYPRGTTGAWRGTTGGR